MMSMNDIDEVFNKLGFGKMQYIILLACLIIQMWVSNEQLGFAVVIAGASCELDIANHRVVWLVSGNFGSQMISCYLWGEISDQYGRRKVLVLAGLTANFLSLLSACMPEFWSFWAFRTLAGFFISGNVVCIMTYLSEFTKVSLRPKVQNIMSYAIGLSLIYVPSLAGVLLPLKMKPIRGWRILLICNQIPGIIGLLLMVLLPESPKYYLSVGNQEKAMKVMEQVCRMNRGKGVTLESLGVDSLTQPRLRDSLMNTDRCHDTKTLMTKHLKFICIFFYIFFTLSGMGFSLPTWMLRIRVLANQVEEQKSVCNLIKDDLPQVLECELGYDKMIAPITHGFVVLGIFILTSILLIRLKRRVVIIIYILIAIAGCVSLNFTNHSDLILLGFFAIIDPPLCSLRLASSLLIDLVPTHLRGKAFALISMMGRAGVLVINLYVGLTLSKICYVTFNLLILLLIVCGILVLILPSEYKVRSLIMQK
ncbi:putative transporter SVOPL isoform X2 [Drosophila elegans]|uniref:putative transporter SVOPL isoform X2 n=1 Tax=Drosophila elegans TaxID=30023 RepID=UPI001BC844BB|nr:putative transporter SVOPL isoform X2 [Drosophila elegans]